MSETQTVTVQEQEPTLEERIEEELKTMDEKNTMVMEQIKAKSDELARLKESALIIMGAKSMLVKLKGGENEVNN